MNLTATITILLIPTVFGWLCGRMIAWFVFHPQQIKNLAGLKFQGIVPSMLEKSRATLVEHVVASLQAIGQSGTGNDNAALLLKIKPTIESHVDHFLQHKLKELFPLLFPLMGDKTIQKFKVAFLNEIDLLFPGIMKQLVAEASNAGNLRERVSEKFNSIDVASIEQHVLLVQDNPLNKLPWLLALWGLFTGLILLLSLSLLG